jgi:rhodanese-related sulfurtransferase/DNA-binding transcriptional ArsR family regulator
MSMGDAVLKAELFEQLGRVGKALGSAKRLELLDLLSQTPRSVADLAATAGLGLTTASMHLKALREAGLVATSREGTTIRYRLAGDDVAALFAQLRAVAAAHLGDVNLARDRYLGTLHGDDTDQVDRDELVRRVRAGDVIVLDVRPTVEFTAGHIPGAICIPLDELSDRLSELSADLEVVAYCRGAYCVLAHDAVRLLNAHGRRAVRLAEGMLEWRLAHHPIEAAS